MATLPVNENVPRLEAENGTPFVGSNSLRKAFTVAMSAIYAREVPLYQKLLDISRDTRRDHTSRSTASLTPHNLERHGAIRVGSPSELQILRRAFALMGMEPVGYYDLSQAGLPVHSTAFRPTHPHDLASCPFRIFTSLLRLDLLPDMSVRKDVQAILDSRQIVRSDAVDLIDLAEREGGLTPPQASAFLTAFVETFKWRNRTIVSKSKYMALGSVHPLVADIVCFPGPHINHLTPAVLDIDYVHSAMRAADLLAKAIIEGPPARKCPILLRQTAFKAVEERICFSGSEAGEDVGTHRARFGEVEARGVALTPKGQALYDRLLCEVRAEIIPDGDGHNDQEYITCLRTRFAEFPDDWSQMHKQGLAYFYGPSEPAHIYGDGRPEPLKGTGLQPIKYEDFLPVSAAGIFRSNLNGSGANNANLRPGNIETFENYLDGNIIDMFSLYAEQSLPRLHGAER